MKQKFLFSFILCCALLFACDGKEGEQNDTIKLSTKRLVFGYSASTQEITTKGEKWVIDYVTVNNVSVEDFPSQGNGNGDFYYEGEWFQLKRTAKKLEVSVKENTTNEIRRIHIYISDANYFTSVNIEQKAK
ncbi:hypothetical protein [Dysgonomonas reticulitermitis]